MWAKTHSAAPSAEEFPVAIAARLLPFSLKPIDTSCATMDASGSTGARGSPPAPAPGPPPPSSASAVGSSSSPGASPVARTLSTSTVSGMGTKTSSFFGVQSSAT